MPKPAHFSHNARGLSLIEVLLGLTIGAMLLGATAAAFMASAGSLRANEAYFQATQQARVASTRLCSAVRNSIRTRISADGNTVFVEVPSGGGTTWHAYVYDAVNKQLLLETAPGTWAAPPTSWNTTLQLPSIRSHLTANPPSGAVLARSLTSLTFAADFGTRTVPGDPSQTETTVVNLHIHLTLENGDTAFSVDESVVPRRTVLSTPVSAW